MDLVIALSLFAVAQLGEWGTKAKTSLDELSKLDVKSTDAEQKCVAARTFVSMGERRKESGVAEVSAEIEKICKVSDAWAPLLRLVPSATGPNRAAYCGHVKTLIQKLKASKYDVEELEGGYAKSCEQTLRMDATGGLAGLAKMDPSSDGAIAICRDARIEAMQKSLKDKEAGAAMEKKLVDVCAVPDLWSSLRFAADLTKPETMRDGECIAANYWISTYTKSRKLVGKQLAAAKKAFAKPCGKWKHVHPMKELARLPKLDPRSEDARALCVRANIWVFAHKVEAEQKVLDVERTKLCARVEGWFNALASACLIADTQLEKKRTLVSADEYAEMTKQLKARCK